MDWQQLRPLQALVARRFFEKRFLMLMLPRQEGKTELAVRLIKSCMDSGLTETRQTTFISKDKESAKRQAREVLAGVRPKAIHREHQGLHATQEHLDNMLHPVL